MTTIDGKETGFIYLDLDLKPSKDLYMHEDNNNHKEVNASTKNTDTTINQSTTTTTKTVPWYHDYKYWRRFLNY